MRNNLVAPLIFVLIPLKHSFQTHKRSGEHFIMYLLVYTTFLAGAVQYILHFLKFTQSSCTLFLTLSFVDLHIPSSWHISPSIHVCMLFLSFLLFSCSSHPFLCWHHFSPIHFTLFVHLSIHS